MEHVDWIVSFTIFIFVILGVITAIPNFLPDITTQEEIKTSKLLYSSLLEEIEVINISVDDNQEIYTFMLDSNYGRANSNYVLEDNVVYGTVYKNSKFYKFSANNTLTKTLLLKEEFLDTNNLKMFDIEQGEVITFNGEGYVFQESIIASKENYSNFYAEYIIEPTDLNIYFNYQSENNYSLCGINNNKFYLYDKNLSGEYLIEEIDIDVDLNLWINFIFKSNYKGEVFCKIGDYLVDNNFQTSVNFGKIIINNESEHYANSFRIYQDNYLKKDNNIIETNFFDLNLNDTNTASINLYDNREEFGKININFNTQLNIGPIIDNFPAIIKDDNDNHKLVIFPNTKEFIIVNDNQDLNFTLENDLKLNYYDYELIEDTNLFLWTKVNLPEDDIFYIYIYKTNGYTSENDFEKIYDAETHPNITINEISSQKYKLDVNNLGKEAQNNYEIKIPVDNTNISIGDSLLITDIDYNLEEKIVLINKDENKFVNFYFIDGENVKNNCQTNILQDNFSINCPEKTYIKGRIEDSIEEYPTIKINNSLEQLITSEKIEEYLLEDNDNYYVRIYNQKENIELSQREIFGNFSLFERITKYLNEKGEEEIVKVLIKPN
jgi:hypothetical protein